MTRVFNAPTAFKEEMMEGYVAAYSRYLQRVPNASGVMAVGTPVRGKVSLLIGGGSGHYPAMCGLVGRGMAAGAVVGDIFTSPSTEQVYRCTKALDGGAGVLYSYGNYSGDVMNFSMAESRCQAEGIDVRTVLVTDDVASAPPDQIEDRRGIAGDFFVFKVAGASAERGDNLDRVEAITRHANDNTRSFGVAFAGCTIPGQSGPLFTVDPSKMEVGLGIHGEPGVRTADMLPASEIAKLMVDTVLVDTPQGVGSHAAVLLNGLGTTKYEELFVLYKDIHRNLNTAGIQTHDPFVGEFVTSLDMAGCSLSLMWLDDELQPLYDAPASDALLYTSGSLAMGNTNAAVARLAINKALEVVLAREEELGRLDAVAGDGDHGAGMARGFRAAMAAVGDDDSAPGPILVKAGTAFSDAAGGASGALVGMLIMTVGQALPGDGNVVVDSAAVHQALDKGLTAIRKLGKAQPGDKTMVDTLDPFVRTLGEQAASGATLLKAWAAALPAAEQGAQSTADMISKRGRAARLGERSRGHLDAGAMSMLYVLRAVGDALTEGCGRG